MDSRKDAEDDRQSSHSSGPRLDASEPPTSHSTPDTRYWVQWRIGSLFVESPIWDWRTFTLSPVRRTLHSNSINTPPPQLTEFISSLSLNIGMSDRAGVVRGTRRRRSISEYGHPRLNSTILDSELAFDGHELIGTCNNVIHRSQPIIGDETGSFIESPMGLALVLDCKPDGSLITVIENFLLLINWTPLKERFRSGKL